MAQYDYYHQWLGIKPKDQPPTLYQLLGISEFEHDSDVIRNATERQSSHVRRLGRGKFTDIGQALLNELAEAKLTLLNPQKRDTYDAQLRRLSQEELRPGKEPSDREDYGGNPALDAQDAGSAFHPERQRPDAESLNDKTDDDLDAEQSDESRQTIDEQVITNGEERFGNVRELTTRIELTREQAKRNGREGWVIGYNAGCNFHVDCPAVSSVHCKFTWVDGKLFLRDLNSTNGTYVNRRKLRAAQRIRLTDLVTLGRDQRIVFPRELFDPVSVARAGAFIFVGQGSGNELRLESASVSTYHAQLQRVQDKIFLIDLKSTNGTYVVNSKGKRRLTEPYLLAESDRVCFGDCILRYRDLDETLTYHQYATTNGNL